MKELKRPGVHFPVLRMSGGPAAVNLKAELDGREIERVHRIEITADVNDVVRVTTFQMVEVELELSTPEVVDGGWIASIYAVVVERIGDGKVKRRVPVAIGKGDSQPDALRDAIVVLEQLEAENGPVQ